ncbi:hypothetical protein FEI15_05520 [Lacticaseibacillus zeae]|uniref:Uncharacterized protein n=1 Tax=Lacticaseibacillus zeae TaxID=57037 RepID=A0A5R8LSN3_LACZE|nr:hypothetical protein FEI15_05520 [Lacticaseibacillus zeae]
MVTDALKGALFEAIEYLTALSITRSQSQKSACKDLRPKWPKPSHLGLRPLTLRFLNAPVRAQQKKPTSKLVDFKRLFRN